MYKVENRYPLPCALQHICTCPLYLCRYHPSSCYWDTWLSILGVIKISLDYNHIRHPSPPHPPTSPQIRVVFLFWIIDNRKAFIFWFAQISWLTLAFGCCSKRIVSSSGSIISVSDLQLHLYTCSQ